MDRLGAAVIFFSLDGNTRHLAELIAEGARAELIELTPRKEQPSGSTIKHIWGATQLSLPEEPLLEPIKQDPHDYDLLFVGTPVWSGGVAPPVRTFLRGTEFFRHRFALFAAYSGRTGRVFREFNELVRGNEILGELGVREPLQQEDRDLRKRIEAWTAELLKNVN